MHLTRKPTRGVLGLSKPAELCGKAINLLGNSGKSPDVRNCHRQHETQSTIILLLLVSQPNPTGRINRRTDPSRPAQKNLKQAPGRPHNQSQHSSNAHYQHDTTTKVLPPKNLTLFKPDGRTDVVVVTQANWSSCRTLWTPKPSPRGSASYGRARPGTPSTSFRAVPFPCIKNEQQLPLLRMGEAGEAQPCSPRE